MSLKFNNKKRVVGFVFENIEKLPKKLKRTIISCLLDIFRQFKMQKCSR